MDVERLIAELTDYAANGFRGQATADACREAAAALAKLHAERDEAREALRPFADACDDCADNTTHDTQTTWESPMAMCVTFGNFREAQRVLRDVP